MLGQETQGPSPLARAYLREVGIKVTPLVSLPSQFKGKGTAQVQVQIRGDGSINEITTKNSTGPQAIAEALQQAFLKAQPLPPPPPTLLKDGIYQLTITYSPAAHVSETSPKVASTVPADSTPLDSYQDGFPEQYISHIADTGADMVWRRRHLRGDIFGNTPDPLLSPMGLLIKPGDGAAVIYTTAPHPEFKPGMTPNDKLQQLIRNPGTKGARYALLHKKDNGYSLLPLNYSPSNPAVICTTCSAGNLSSRYDAAEDRYLLFDQGVGFTSATWDSSIPSWEHFDAWWLDAKNEKIDHIVLPAGPWVTDAKLDAALLREFRNFSCGVDCYRHYNIIKVDSGNIFVSISGTPAAIHESVTGIYKLSPGGTKWEKVKN